MTFDSTTFLIFFLFVLFIHGLPLPWTARKTNLLVASYLFYAAWNPPFVLLIWLSTLVDYQIAARIYRSDDPSRRRWLLVATLVTNLGLLGYFKYGGFVLESFTVLCQSLGFDYQPAAWDIILPVGISFYTFQTLSYSLDVYLGRTKPSKSFLDYALYVTFFPQLVAGPIVRSTDFLPQCVEPKRFQAENLAYGFGLITMGLFLKVVLADALMAPITDTLYGTSAALISSDAWLGTLAFTVQIYCDFAGYSSCAIGAAYALGFRLPANFNSPYAALGFSDFWRRWHISLSTWLRDYLYIVLGGNRRGVRRTQINLMITMALGGLWHGASWTLVVWGVLHGAYLIVERWLTALLGHQKIWARPPARFFIWALTFAATCFAWVFFRSDNFPQALDICAAMLGAFDPTGTSRFGLTDAVIVLTVLVGVLAANVTSRSVSLDEIFERTPRWLMALGLGLMLTAVLLSNGDDRAFIYFQF